MLLNDSEVDGSTEMGNIPCLLPERREDWEWLCWHPALNVDMEPASGPAYELVLNRDSDGEQYRAISNTILRDSSQYRSQDLFIVSQGFERIFSQSTKPAL